MPVPGQQLGGITAQLGGVVLGQVDASGVQWTLATLEGWDSPEVRATLTDRQQDHGAWFSPVYYGSRPVVLTGVITAPSMALLDAAIDQLLAACSVTDTTLVVRDSTPRQATVRRSGKPIIQRITDAIASYSLQVTAQDPRRYDVNQQTVSTGLPSTSGGLVLPAVPPWTLSATTVLGAIAVTNAGNFESRPVLTISGPVSQPVVTANMPDGSIRSLTYTGADLAVGNSLLIDTDARTVTQGGVSRRRWMQISGGGWPTIPAGATVQFQFRAGTYNSSALLTVSWRSAWI